MRNAQVTNEELSHHHAINGDAHTNIDFQYYFQVSYPSVRKVSDTVMEIINEAGSNEATLKLYSTEVEVVCDMTSKK